MAADELETDGPRLPPHNLDAEAALLGALLLSRDAAAAVEPIITAADFYRPAGRHIFQAVMDLHRTGQTADPITVADELRRRDLLDAAGGTAALVDLQADAPGTTNAAHYARIVVDHARLRRAITVGAHLIERAYACPADVAGVLDEAQAGLSEIGPVELGGRTTDLRTVDAFLAEEEANPLPWVIPGLLRRGWRCLAVAGEGAGKSVLARQLALGLAAGHHPFTHEPMTPGRSLIVDLENPRDAIAETLVRARDAAVQTGDYDPDRAHIVPRFEGIDLRSRTGRLHLEALIAETRPDLVCLGPIYRTYHVGPRESDEQAAGEVMDVFVDLVARYGFALFLEHHAPQGSGGVRDIRPIGTSRWLRWPEIGLKLLRSQYPDRFGPGSLFVDRWRPDRVRCTWPTHLKRTRMWPWTGIYDGVNEAAA